jgi:hypothetical protein
MYPDVTRIREPPALIYYEAQNHVID